MDATIEKLKIKCLCIHRPGHTCTVVAVTEFTAGILSWRETLTNNSHVIIDNDDVCNPTDVNGVQVLKTNLQLYLIQWSNLTMCCYAKEKNGFLGCVCVQSCTLTVFIATNLPLVDK